VRYGLKSPRYEFGYVSSANRDLNLLAEKVEEMLKAGWKLHGGIFFQSQTTELTQAFIRTRK
jgi:Domain of unknown function (DUF1737)